jgi:hypothetical protein
MLELMKIWHTTTFSNSFLEWYFCVASCLTFFIDAIWLALPPFTRSLPPRLEAWKPSSRRSRQPQDNRLWSVFCIPIERLWQDKNAHGTVRKLTLRRPRSILCPSDHSLFRLHWHSFSSTVTRLIMQNPLTSGASGLFCSRLWPEVGSIPNFNATRDFYALSAS